MNRIEQFQLIENGIVKYLQIPDAVNLFGVHRSRITEIAIEYGLFENPAKLKKTKGKKPVLKALESLKVFQELGLIKPSKKEKNDFNEFISIIKEVVFNENKKAVVDATA